MTQQEIEDLHYTPSKPSKKLISLVGKQFYSWTVLEQAPPIRGRTMWKCRCSCGKLGIVSGYDLKSGKHKSCGHSVDKKEVSKIPKVHSRIDCTNQIFGIWKALEYAGDQMWRCQHIHTGEIKLIQSYYLRKIEANKTETDTVNKAEDLTGRQFSEWKVLRYIGGKHSKWECQCTCGKISAVSAYDLKVGNSRNCGHNRNTPYINMVGQRYGRLTVLSYDTKGKYTCKCDCGTVKEYLGSNIRSGETISCGCAHKTIFTYDKIREILIEYTDKYGDKPTAGDIAAICNVTPTYISQLVSRYELEDLLNRSFKSLAEREIYSYLKGIRPDLEIQVCNRKLLYGYELDLYIPSLKIGIEYNGDFWHSELYKEPRYHLDKSKAFEAIGIRVLHIFEYEWVDPVRRIKIENLLKNVVSNEIVKVHARKCEVRTLGSTEEREFLESYHLQNYVSSSVAYGLYHSDEIIAVMTFGRPRMTDKAEYELLRLAIKPGYRIIGGAEKLFNAFKSEYTPNSVVSYCDIAKFTGGVYQRLGMRCDGISDPGYSWIDIANHRDIPRYKTQKHLLIKAGYGNESDTEVEIMRNLGYQRVYNCGNYRYIYESSEI